MHSKLLLMAAMLGASAFAADVSQYFPLATGNEWTYRDSAGASFTVRVGLPAYIGGHTYYRLTGYVSTPLWVRLGDEGLLFRDEERDLDRPLTLFRTDGASRFDAPFRPCDQEGSVDREGVEIEGPSGRVTNALRILYSSSGCADAGIEEEIFQDSIGMLRRIETTIAGPRQFDLADARVGYLTVSKAPGTSFTLTLGPPKAAGEGITANMQLDLGMRTLLVRKPVGQSFDLALKDETGRTLWRWSDGRVFPAAIEEVVLIGRSSFEAAVPLTIGGLPLPTGEYVIEAWLTTGDDRIQFSAATTLSLFKAESPVRRPVVSGSCGKGARADPACFVSPGE